MGIDYRFSTLFATIVGVFFSFKTFGRYVFLNTRNSLIYKFFTGYSSIYILNVGLVTAFNIVIDNYYLSGFFAAIFCAIISFFLNKFYIFK
jgi:putative flippase GtrA